MSMKVNTFGGNKWQRLDNKSKRKYTKVNKYAQSHQFRGEYEIERASRTGNVYPS